MPPWLKKTLIAIGILILLLLIGIFLTKNIQKTETTTGAGGLLPGALDRLAPKPGDLDYIPPDTTGGLLDASEIVIDDKNLAGGLKKLDEMESTVISYRSKLDEAQIKMDSYNQLSQESNGAGTTVTSSLYGQNFQKEMQELKQSIAYYHKVIYIYEHLITKFKASIVYYYCNGYTPVLPGDTVETKKLQFNIIIVHHANGTTTEVSCQWDGVPTEFTPDSEYHPKNFFTDLPPEYADQLNYGPNGNPFKDVSYNYISEQQWGSFPSQLTDVDWIGTPSVWLYYLDVYYAIYIDLSVSFSIDLQGLWQGFFKKYPIDDYTEFSNIHLWIDRYKTFTNDGTFTSWGLLNSGHPANNACPVLRMGLLANSSWFYILANGKRSQNFDSKDECQQLLVTDPSANQTIACQFDPSTPPSPLNPPSGILGFLKDFFTLGQSQKRAVTLEYAMDSLKPWSIKEYPLNIINEYNWFYTTASGVPSTFYPSRDICRSAKGNDPNASQSDCEASFTTSHCSSTVPGQAKNWYVTVPDYDQSEPYVFDIVDAHYARFQFNWNTLGILKMPHRYYGPQYVSDIDTQHVYAYLQYNLAVSTEEDEQETGLPIRYAYSVDMDPITSRTACEDQRKQSNTITDGNCRPYPYTSVYRAEDKHMNLLFNIQTRNDIRTENVQDLPFDIFTLPLELTYTVLQPNGSAALYRVQPTMVSARANEDNVIGSQLTAIDNQYSTVYLYFEGISGMQNNDMWQLVDTERGEVLVSGTAGEIVTFGQQQYSDNGPWKEKWYYIASYDPKIFSEYYDTESECKQAGLEATGKPVICYKKLLRSLQIFLLEENIKDKDGNLIGSTYTTELTRLSYNILTHGQPITFGFAYGETPNFSEMKVLSTKKIVSNEFDFELAKFEFKDLKPGTRYYYKLFHAGSSIDNYNASAYPKLKDSNGKELAIFHEGTFIPSEKNRSGGLSFDSLFTLPKAVNPSAPQGVVGLVQCGYDMNDDGLLTKDEVCGFNHFIELISRVLNFILFILLPTIIMFFVMWAGYIFVTKGDRPNEITKAKEILKWTVLGALVMLFSWYLVSFVFSLLGAGHLTWLQLASATELYQIKNYL